MSLSQRAMGTVGSTRPRWSVYFFRKGKWRRKRFRDDFGAALRFHNELLSNDRVQGVTLHCDNIAFHPPDHIINAEREEWRVVTRNVKVGGVKKRKKFKKKVIVHYNKMVEYNAQGIWWCPYCIKLRRFKEITTDRGMELCCPVCWISNYAVREFNPKALDIEYRKPQQRTPSGKRRRRKR